jgi:ribonuclease P protein component
VLAGPIVSKTGHFALHRRALEIAVAGFEKTPASSPPLFAVQDIWIGAMVPKRWAKRAVTRNTIKRQIYCIGESFGDRLLSQAHVVRLRKGFDRAVYTSATSEALKLAVRAEIEALFNSAATRVAIES